MPKKDELGKFDSNPIKVRFTPQILNKLKARAIENRTSVSEIIRQACYQYFDSILSDSEIMHASLASNNKKIKYLENKVELLGLIILELAKKQIKFFPTTSIKDNLVCEAEFEEFMNDCTKSLKSQHRGMLEKMILDIYEQEEQ